MESPKTIIIKRHLDVAGISKAELARRCGISRQLLNLHLQNPNKVMTPVQAKGVAKYLSEGKSKEERRIFEILIGI